MWELYLISWVNKIYLRIKDYTSWLKKRWCCYELSPKQFPAESTNYILRTICVAITKSLYSPNFWSRGAQDLGVQFEVAGL